MTWVAMIKLQLHHFKARYGPKICTEDVKKGKNEKIQSLKDLWFINRDDVIDKTYKSSGIKPPPPPPPPFTQIGFSLSGHTPIGKSLKFKA